MTMKKSDYLKKATMIWGERIALSEVAFIERQSDFPGWDPEDDDTEEVNGEVKGIGTARLRRELERRNHPGDGPMWQALHALEGIEGAETIEQFSGALDLLNEALGENDTDETALNRCGVCGDRGIMGLCGDCATLLERSGGIYAHPVRPWTRRDLNAWLQDKGINPAFHETGAHLHPEVTINFRPMRWGLDYAEARFSEPRV